MANSDLLPQGYILSKRILGQTLWDAWSNILFCGKLYYYEILKGEYKVGNEDLFKMRKVIKYTLIRIGFRVDLIGFSYLCYAIELVILNPKLIHNLCKGLYVQVGEKFMVNNDLCIERSIRHSIENTYINKSFSEINKLFKMEIFSINDKPTCGELIKLVAEYYNLSLYENDMAV